MTHTRCRTCGQPVIVAVDDLGIQVTLDPASLTPAGEALAIVMTKRRTWRLAPVNTKRHAREVWKRTALTIGEPVRGGTLHTSHVCGQPIPPTWIQPPPPPKPAPTEEPMF